MTPEERNHADIFSTTGQFPSLDYADFPIAEEVARYFKYGPNFLQRGIIRL